MGVIGGGPTTRRLDTRHLARHARKAIAERLSHPAEEALRAVERDSGAVVLRLNSGGNALAVADYLRQRGYHAEQDGGNPDGYGCAVRVADAVLTRRQRTVAVLVACGLTNRQIARVLVLSELTVRTHVHDVYAKTGVHGRRLLAQWVKEQVAATAAEEGNGNA